MLELAPHVLLVERTNDSPGRIDALAYADYHAALNQRMRFVLDRKVTPLGNAPAIHPLRAPADQDRVLVPLGSHQADPRALTLKSAD